MTGATATRLVYVHDPMCSWCWAFRPVLARVVDGLPPGVACERLLGGLAPDDDAPMPTEMRRALEGTWRRIETLVPGTRFDYTFWRDAEPRRSTFRSCRAVIAAREQDAAHEVPMIEAIQRAYYLEARNPSDRDVLIDLAKSIGADAARFAVALDDPRVHAALATERELSGALGVQGFPGLVLVTEADDGRARAQPLAVDYHDADVVLARLSAARAA